MQGPHLLQFRSHHGSTAVKHKDNVLWQRRKICGSEVVYEIPIKNLWKSKEVRNQRQIMMQCSTHIIMGYLVGHT